MEPLGHRFLGELVEDNWRTVEVARHDRHLIEEGAVVERSALGALPAARDVHDGAPLVADSLQVADDEGCLVVAVGGAVAFALLRRQFGPRPDAANAALRVPGATDK